MGTNDVTVVADGEGLVIARLCRMWLGNAVSSRRHELVFSDVSAPYSIVRRASRTGLLFWADHLMFGVHGRAPAVPQCVLLHHFNEPEEAHYRAILPHADAVAVTAVSWQRRVAALTGIEAAMVPHVIDTREVRPLDRSEVRRAHGIDEDAFVIGFSARALSNAYGRKGIDLFLRVVHAAAATWTNVTALVIGSGWESLQTSLEATRATIVRHVPLASEDAAPLYSAMDAFVCTSLVEGGPFTVLEAMASGVPVVSTPVGHVPDIVVDGETGFVVSDRDERAFLERLRVVRDRGDEIGRAAREWVVSNRDERVVHLDLDAMYQRAERRFAERSRLELGARAPWRGRLLARYAGRQLIRRLRGQL